jgi:hypothetical protein
MARSRAMARSWPLVRSWLMARSRPFGALFPNGPLCAMTGSLSLGASFVLARSAVMIHFRCAHRTLARSIAMVPSPLMAACHVPPMRGFAVAGGKMVDSAAGGDGAAPRSRSECPSAAACSTVAQPWQNTLKPRQCCALAASAWLQRSQCLVPSLSSGSLTAQGALVGEVARSQVARCWRLARSQHMAPSSQMARSLVLVRSHYLASRGRGSRGRNQFRVRWPATVPQLLDCPASSPGICIPTSTASASRAQTAAGS